MKQLRMPTPTFGATVVFLLCFLGYVLSISPTVTFWDAGEFLAAASALGVPHPPGTPLFVVLSNAWGQIFPFGEYAFRVGVLTAALGAMSAALLYLVVFHALRGNRGTGGRVNLWQAHGAAFAGALVSAFAFSVWQSSNEAEVYMFAAVIASGTALLAILWRQERGTARGAKYLLLSVYLLAVSVGIHLLGLLVGPALIVFVWHQLRTQPHKDIVVRREEFAYLAMIAAIWVLLVAIGLGKKNPLLIGTALVATALAIAWVRGAALFGFAALAVSALGVSTYAYIYVRAGLAPAINMGDASTWDALTALIARKQYPPRLPWDNPLFESGPNNPGRTFELVWLQIANYLQYFDWQWSRGVAAAETYFAWPRLPITLTFLSLGTFGANVLYRRDRSAFWMLLFYFAVTGPGLVAYMNFKPGFSIGYAQFPDFSQHEVRERDYFFLLSFQVWGMWVGIGISRAYQLMRDWLASLGMQVTLRRAMAVAPYGLAFLPFVLNHSEANRNRGAESQLAIDYAYDLLQSVEPYGVLVTGGDNDTYPLWYAQEALGIRQDVTVVVATLSNMDWLIRHLRDQPVRPFDPEQAPWFEDQAPATIPPPPVSWTDKTIASARPQALPRAIRYQAGNLDRTLPVGTPLYVQDWLLLHMVQESIGKRSIYFSRSAQSSIPPVLRDSMIREGLVLRLYAENTPALSDLGMGVDGFPVHIERTDTLANEVFRYAGLFNVDTSSLDTTERQVINDMGMMFLSLGTAYDSIGDRRRSLENLDRALHLMPGNSGLSDLVEDMRGQLDGSTIPPAPAQQPRDALAIPR